MPRDSKHQKQKRIFELAQVEEEQLELGAEAAMIHHLRNFKIDLLRDLEDTDQSVSL